MKWRDVGMIYLDYLGGTYEVLHACGQCGAVVCGPDIDVHERFHAQLRQDLTNLYADQGSVER